MLRRFAGAGVRTSLSAALGMTLALGLTAPAKALDLEAVAFEVIDLLPLKPEEKGFAKFTVKSPDCAEKLVESVMGDKIMVGMAAAFKVYKPGIKPFDIHSVAECKMKMNPVNFAFSQAMGQSKGLISDMPAPYNSAIQEQADQTLGEFQADANEEMMSAFPFTKHIECACEAAFHEFSPAIENTLASIKTGDAQIIGKAVYNLAIENSSLPIKPIRLVIEGDIEGAATSLVGQYGIPVGCKVAEYLLAVPSQVCEAAAGIIGKGAKFVAGIGEDIYDELAGTAADPNQYYADHWRPMLTISAAYLVGEQYGAWQPGAADAVIVSDILKPCVKYYSDHADVFDEITFSDDDAAKKICDPMRKQFAGLETGGDLGAVVKTARQAARDFYETGFKDAMYKQAMPYAGNSAAVPGPSPQLFAACAKGLDPLISTLPARNETDRQALSDALCNELLLGPNSTVGQDLKAIAASMTPVKSEIQKKKEAAKAEKKKKEADAAEYQAIFDLPSQIKPACMNIVAGECGEPDFLLGSSCQTLLNRPDPLPFAKAKQCVLPFGQAIHEAFNMLAPMAEELKTRCNGLFGDKPNQKACFKKAFAALQTCGKPSMESAKANFKDIYYKTDPDLPAQKMANLVANGAVAFAEAAYSLTDAGLGACGAVEAYFSALEAKQAKQKAIEDAAAQPQTKPGGLTPEGGISGLEPGNGGLPKLNGQEGEKASAKIAAQRDLIRLGCADARQDGKLFACPTTASLKRCHAYKQRGLVGECLTGGMDGNSSQTQGKTLSAQHDLIRLGCEDVNQDGTAFACADAAALKRCKAYQQRGQVRDCAAPDDGQQGASNGDGNEPQQDKTALARRDLIALGCEELEDDSGQFRCYDRASNDRCIAYMKRKQTARCILRAGPQPLEGEGQQGEAAQPAEDGQQAQQQQGGLPPRRDLIRLGCEDVNQDGMTFACTGQRVFNRCQAYKRQGEVAECILRQ